MHLFLSIKVLCRKEFHADIFFKKCFRSHRSWYDLFDVQFAFSDIVKEQFVDFFYNGYLTSW